MKEIVITASLGVHADESGPSFHFNGATFEQLSDIIDNPTATVAYLNQLPNVETTHREMQQVAASGVVRLALSLPSLPVLERAGNMLVDVAGGGTIERDQFTRWGGWGGNSMSVFGDLRLADHRLDSVSVIATRKNQEAETADIIRKKAPTDNGYFMLAIANGGLISAAHTFRHLGEGDHAFGTVRYSRDKCGDKEPYMRPNQDSRRRWLQQMANGRQVVVYDEDYYTAKTIRRATEYFSHLLGHEVIGIAPVEVGPRIYYNPLIARPE